MSTCKNSYTLFSEEGGAGKRYYASFKNGFGRLLRTEVSKKHYLDLVGLERIDRNLKRSDERHRHCSELSDELLVACNSQLNPSAEDQAYLNFLAEDIRSVFKLLPPTQARRFLLVHVFGFSYKELAILDGCSVNAIRNSLVAAKKFLLKSFWEMDVYSPF
jgi:hypothetical protein